MKQIMKLSDRELKITMINIWRVPMEKVNNMQEQMGKVSKETETLRENKNKCYKAKCRTEMKNAFDGPSLD